MAKWANLPIELLEMVSEKLDYIEESVYLSLVCKSWFPLNARKRPSLPTKIPWLMLAEDINQKINNPPQNRLFFSLPTKNIYETELPEASMRKCFGVNFGWLLTLKFNLEVSLLHPFSRNLIALPPLNTLNGPTNYLCNKAVISTNPYLGKKFHLMAICGQHRILAFTTSGDDLWTNVDIPLQNLKDVIFYKGRFYAIATDGSLVVCDLKDDQNPTTSIIIPAFGLLTGREDMYLVELGEDIFLVRRTYIHRRYGIFTENFSVFKMERCIEHYFPFKWVQVESLGSKAIFVGNNSSTSITASEHNERIKADCIYFTENEVVNYEHRLGGRGHDMGVFDMQTHTFESHYDGNCQSYLSPPLWVI